jgi:DNA-binding NarL/FixJ family response regulator
MQLLIVDDHVIVREGLRALLEPCDDVEVVGEATSGQEAIEAVTRLHPDVVLMDITMPGINGLEAARRINEEHPDVKVLILTMHEEDEYFFNALEAGASGYFVKGGSSEELVSALRAVARGDVFLYPTMAKKLLSGYLERGRTVADRDRQDGLTNRELEVLKLIGEGFNNQEIAARLFLSPTTVQTHRSNIMGKLNLHNRADLTRYAIKNGLVSLDH